MIYNSYKYKYEILGFQDPEKLDCISFVSNADTLKEAKEKAKYMFTETWKNVNECSAGPERVLIYRGEECLEDYTKPKSK